ARRPFHLVTGAGEPIMWYLPDTVPIETQNAVFRDLALIAPALRNSVVQSSLDDWRCSRYLFKEDTRSLRAAPGCINVSPGWFAQGHNVASLNLRAGSSQAMLHEWVSASAHPMAIPSAVLAIIHPHQYQQGLRCMRRLRRRTILKPFVDSWASAFNAMTVISNRETLYHRDGGGCFQWYDVLGTYGQYSRGLLSFPALGIDLDYRPGTVVAFAGNVLRHGVPHPDGERVCLAHYMRKNLHEYVHTEHAQWGVC
ncbi:hypothetical protein CONPUDRAFT_36489, partial [Coniophora puteana RWD-64-598 SS2]